MISNIDSNYNAICKLFNFSKESSADINKKLLLEMAKNGEERPKQRTKLGKILSKNTTGKNRNSSFDKKIRKLAPDWFVPTSDISKRKLILMANNGEKKPNQKTKLGKCFCHYTQKSSPVYDESFTKKITNIRKDWFVANNAEVCLLYKKELMNLAKNKNKKRPPYNSKLGGALSRYSCETSKFYDGKFTKKLKNIRPDWFIFQTQIANEKKQQIIEIAKEGKPKPTRSTKLGKTLQNYISPSRKGMTYDLEFHELLKKLRPDWFISQTQIANEKKQQIIEMAKTLSNKKDLGKILLNRIYEYKRTDPSFYLNIKKIRPDWF